ncbi:MAG TPA: hypothetical protein VFH33_00510, partial [Candidatus Krumholzibacteria bacterium]|nr:hypothetical protein [Candidatus Krumholzibacteria bacterium]
MSMASRSEYTPACEIGNWKCETHQLTNRDAVRDIEPVMTPRRLKIRSNLAHAYQDVYTADAVNTLEELARFDADRKALMTARIERRAARARNKARIAFLDERTTIPRTNITVEDARNGAFTGSEIP